MVRVITYIDGFNLYFGMTEKKKDTKWLDLQKLSSNLLKPDQVLVKTKYFTSRISEQNTNKARRQQTYLEALEEIGVEIIYGRYESRSTKCQYCGRLTPKPSEKMTDVNIATQILMDAMQDHFDKAILISGDSDLIPPINNMHASFPNKSIVVAFPPNRHNASMEKAAKGSFIIGRSKLVKSLLPDTITKKDGFILEKPHGW